MLRGVKKCEIYEEQLLKAMKEDTGDIRLDMKQLRELILMATTTMYSLSLPLLLMYHNKNMIKPNRQGLEQIVNQMKEKGEQVTEEELEQFIAGYQEYITFKNSKKTRKKQKTRPSTTKDLPADMQYLHDEIKPYNNYLQDLKRDNTLPEQDYNLEVKKEHIQRLLEQAKENQQQLDKNYFTAKYEKPLRIRYKNGEETAGYCPEYIAEVMVYMPTNITEQRLEQYITGYRTWLWLSYTLETNS